MGSSHSKPGRWLLAALVLWSGAAFSGQTTVAVASNFLSTFRELAAEFERASGHEVESSSGSTGQLYAQIVNGAPYDLFLAADALRPGRLAEQGIALAESRFTYASGRLALWSAEPGRVDGSTLADLARLDFRWLAIAEPEVAPYGAAAWEVLGNIGARDALEGRIVRQQNVSQAFAAAATRNAEFALVALSQALDYSGPGSFEPVAVGLHEPVRQDAILLRRAATNPAALGFLEFLRGPAAAAIIARHGYLR